jgi:hypothetical protein
VERNQAGVINMKKIPLLLFSLFFLNPSSVFADDFSNFQVVDIGIGDSLLDFMAEDEIIVGIEKLKELNRYSNLKEPYKFLEIIVPRENYIYDKASVFIKNTIPNNYTIYAIRGHKDYIEDFDACIKQRDQIAKILTNMFPDVKTDKSIEEKNQGTYDYFNLIGSKVIIDIYCQDLKETYRLKNGFTEGLTFAIHNEEFREWRLNSK